MTPLFVFGLASLIELVPSLLGHCKQKQRGLSGYYVAGSPLLNGRCTSLLRVPVREMTYITVILLLSTASRCGRPHSLKPPSPLSTFVRSGQYPAPRCRLPLRMTQQ